MWTKVLIGAGEWYYLAWIGEFSCSIFPNANGTADWGICGPTSRHECEGSASSVAAARAEVLAALAGVIAAIEDELTVMRFEQSCLQTASIEDAPFDVEASSFKDRRVAWIVSKRYDSH